MHTKQYGNLPLQKSAERKQELCGEIRGQKEVILWQFRSELAESAVLTDQNWYFCHFWGKISGPQVSALCICYTRESYLEVKKN